ncbi:hypothetical protein OBBRIDRAFT_795541 [Obba rivulosa]|uniref:Uncharacterized protein n=1 Tax=Obba rivulosa TaxID=1052685 RepID=A0A8E2DHF5_9APHY|nr:hypothetical protein OBBRIDRAFT_795541 [Obba rivulosa]
MPGNRLARGIAIVSVSACSIPVCPAIQNYLSTNSGKVGLNQKGHEAKNQIVASREDIGTILERIVRMNRSHVSYIRPRSIPRQFQWLSMSQPTCTALHCINVCGRASAKASMIYEDWNVCRRVYIATNGIR